MIVSPVRSLSPPPDSPEQWMANVARTIAAMKCERNPAGLATHIEATLAGLGALPFASAISPSFRAGLHNELGLARKNNGDPGRADEAFAAALAIEPGHINAAFNRGNLFLAQRRPGEALASFSLVLLQCPEHPGALHHAGLCRLALEQPDEALACFERAALADPNSAGAHYWAGEVLLQAGSWQKALPYFEKSRALAPDFDCALRGLAICKLRAGAFRETVALCERLLSMDAGGQFVGLEIKGDAHLALDEAEQGAACHAAMVLIDFDAREYLPRRTRELRAENPALATAYVERLLEALPDMEPALRAVLETNLPLDAKHTCQGGCHGREKTRSTGEAR